MLIRRMCGNRESAVMSTTDKGEPCFALVQIREPALRSQANVRMTVIRHLEEIGKGLSSK